MPLTEQEIAEYRVSEARKGKTFNTKYNVWIRELDCRVAELVFAFRWLPCGPKRDFAEAPFHVVLTPPPHELNAKYILEPDTRVPNFSTNLEYALYVARTIGLTSMPVLETESRMATWICRKALEE